MKLKQLFEDETGVSPVIGVILMVAITVILAAVIGTFVLDLGNSSMKQNPQVGVSYDAGTDTVTITSVQQADKVTVKESSNSDTDPQAGDTIAAPSGTGKVTVTATYNGNTVVIATFDDNTA